MGLIIDTSVFIHWERSGRVVDFSVWENHGDAGISAVTASELLVGVQRASTEQRRRHRSAFVEAILNKIPVFDFSLPIARIHAELFATLTNKGQMIGAHDLIIAATARHLGYSILTGNVAEFRRIPSLNVLSFS